MSFIIIKSYIGHLKKFYRLFLKPKAQKQLPRKPEKIDLVLLRSQPDTVHRFSTIRDYFLNTLQSKALTLKSSASPTSPLLKRVVDTGHR